MSGATRSTARFNEPYDLFLCPTVAHPPVPIEELALGRLERLGLALLRAVLLVRVAAELEAAHPWAQRRPRVLARAVSNAGRRR